MQLRGAANRSWYTTEEIGAALRGASEALGDRAPSSRAYHQWRKALLAESRARGSRLSLPSDVAIYDHYPNWAAALHGAGLISDDEIAVVRRRISPVSRDRVAAALLDFIGQSPTVTRTEYVRWRKRQPMHLGTRDAPDCWGMIKRFGTWPVLVEAARHALLSSDPQSELVRMFEEMERCRLAGRVYRTSPGDRRHREGTAGGNTQATRGDAGAWNRCSVAARDSGAPAWPRVRTGRSRRRWPGDRRLRRPALRARERGLAGGLDAHRAFRFVAGGARTRDSVAVRGTPAARSRVTPEGLKGSPAYSREEAMNGSRRPVLSWDDVLRLPSTLRSAVCSGTTLVARAMCRRGCPIRP